MFEQPINTYILSYNMYTTVNNLYEYYCTTHISVIYTYYIIKILTIFENIIFQTV